MESENAGNRAKRTGTKGREHPRRIRTQRGLLRSTAIRGYADNCRICARVCPVGFISKREQTSVRIGGKQFAYNSKRSDLRCLCNTVCSGPLEVRKKWMELLFHSGVVELDEEGREVVVKLDEQGNRTARGAASEVD